jgi:predicted Rdx family selenoprotein
VRRPKCANELGREPKLVEGSGGIFTVVVNGVTVWNEKTRAASRKTDAVNAIVKAFPTA